MSALFFEVLKQVDQRKSLKQHVAPIMARGHLYTIGKISDSAFEEIEAKVKNKPVPDDLTFLPSEVTVVYTEVMVVNQVDGTPDRVMPVLVVAQMLEDGRLGVFSFVATRTGDVGLGPALMYDSRDMSHILPTKGPGKLFVDPDSLDEDRKITYRQMASVFLSCLVMINSVSTKVRRQWEPTQRRQAKGFRGAYFNGYTEVEIKERTVSVDAPGTSGIHKCLHYVRAHRRVYKSGKVVVVPEHWRGDPKLGVKDHRYVVKMTYHD